jgi:hypothetical protein
MPLVRNETGFVSRWKNECVILDMLRLFDTMGGTGWNHCFQSSTLRVGQLRQHRDQGSSFIMEQSMNWRIACATWALFVLPFFGVMTQAADDVPPVIEFNRDIRPILSENCFFCHGPDKNKRQADLRLDTLDGLTRHPGDPAKPGAVVPGKPGESELVRRIISSDSEKVMPPTDSGKRLTPRDIQLLKQWIEQGANYEGHWAFLPIKRPANSIQPDAVKPGATLPTASSVIEPWSVTGSPVTGLNQAPKLTESP